MWTVLCITKLTNQLKRSMVKAESKHQEYDNSCQNVRQTCILAAEESKKMRIAAQSKKKATQGVGGALAATTIAASVGTGVALSVVAGVFTFGIGTVVGLGITAGATAIGGAAVGTGTAIATHVIAMDFEKTEKALRSLSFTFDSMERISSDLLNSVGEVHSKVLHLSSLIDDVDRNEKSEEKRVLIAAVNRLLHLLEEYYKYSSFCRDAVSSKRKELTSKMDSL